MLVKPYIFLFSPIFYNVKNKHLYFYDLFWYYKLFFEF
jgi:hypothetical protein